MVFTSFQFVVFFFVTITIGHLLKNKAQKYFLLLASYYFYGAFEPTYLLILWGSSTWDFVSALGIRARRRRKDGLAPESFVDRLDFLSPRAWLVLSLAINISVLAYFKYTNFGIEILNDVNPLGDTILAWPAANILLPIGISFFTFQSMSYVIDCYRGVIEPRRSYVDYSMYVAFFPHMVAGPIVRSKTFFAGMDNRFKVTREDMIVGCTRIVHGFFRKLVLSDNLVPLADGVFNSHMTMHPLDVWLGAFAYCWRIYLDFAGYSDIARGVARLFGIEFEVNFLYPMAANSIRDHWSRWHLSFTTWIRDYIYIPLGGSKLGEFRTYINIFITWLFAGIWHGPAYHFVVWGVYQGVMIGIHREYGKTKFSEWLNAEGALGFAWNISSRVITMFFLCFGFIWFRAETMTKSLQMQGRLFGAWDLLAWAKAFRAWLFSDGPWSAVGNALSVPAGMKYCWAKAPPDSGCIYPLYTKFLILIGLYYLYEYLMNHFQLEYFWKPENRRKLIAVMCFALFCIIVFATPETPNFIYFQFRGRWMQELVKFLKDPRFYGPVAFLLGFELFLQTGIYKNYLEPHSYADNVNQIVHKIKASRLEPDTLILGTSVTYQGLNNAHLNSLLSKGGHTAQSGACEGAMLEVQHTIYRNTVHHLPKLRTLVHITEVTFPWTSRYQLDSATRTMMSQFPRSEVMPLLRDYKFDIAASDYTYFYIRSLTYQKDLRDLVMGPLDRIKGITRRGREPYSDYVYENKIEFKLSSYPSKDLHECMAVAGKGIPPADKNGKPVTDRHHQNAVFRTCQVGLDDPMKKAGAPQWSKMYFERLSLLYAEARERGLDIITVIPPHSELISDMNANERMQIWRNELKKAQKTDTPHLIDLRHALDGPQNRDYYYDTIHLNKFGAIAFTEKLAEALLKDPGYARTGRAGESAKK